MKKYQMVMKVLAGIVTMTLMISSIPVSAHEEDNFEILGTSEISKEEQINNSTEAEEVEPKEKEEEKEIVVDEKETNEKEEIVEGENPETKDTNLVDSTSDLNDNSSSPIQSTDDLFVPEIESAYNKEDVAIINSIIERNGLKGYSKDDPSNWDDFVVWSDDSTTNKRVIALYINDEGLVGSLNVSKLTSLILLDCSDNQLEELDVSGLIYLEDLFCDNNPLTNFVLQDGRVLTLELDGRGTVNLDSYDLNSNQIIYSAIVNRGYVINWQSDDIKIENSTSNILAFTMPNKNVKISVFSVSYNPEDVAVINSIIENNGLEGYSKDDPDNWDFIKWSNDESNKRVVELALGAKGLKGSLDVSGLTDLIELSCFDNQLEELDASGLTNLKKLYCSENQLKELDVNGLTNLITLYCSENPLETLDVSGLAKLEKLSCANNQLEKLDISRLMNLIRLACNDNQLEELDISGLTSLTSLDCANNQLKVINGLTSLTSLNCSNNQLDELDISGLASLWYLDCSVNQLEKLEVSGLTKLEVLSCGGNQLEKLDVSGLTSLNWLYCSDNPLTNLVLPDGRVLTLELNDGGTVNLDSYDFDTNEITYSATANTGYGINWKSKDIKISDPTSNILSFTMPDSNVTISVFKKNDNSYVQTEDKSLMNVWVFTTIFASASLIELIKRKRRVSSSNEK